MEWFAKIMSHKLYLLTVFTRAETNGRTHSNIRLLSNFQQMFCFNYQTFATMAITVKTRFKDSEARFKNYISTCVVILRISDLLCRDT